MNRKANEKDNEIYFYKTGGLNLKPKLIMYKYVFC